ncbi:MAG TPA: RES family NAD+ phosphorylase, partial [Casimicrobiaceae bacterium]|nr:RES family NAD+ phosphorylase [Casimicrobiaceae bacterium]
MPQHHQLLHTLAQDIANRRAPLSVAEAFEQLSPLSIGLRQKIPVLPEGARMFRIRKMAAKPQLIAAVGAPAARLAPVGRLNDHGQSVLYLADSPDTAFAEARAIDGQYCLSECRTQRPKVGLANGGLDSAFLAEHFPKDLDSPDAIRGGTEDLDVLAFFTFIFTLSVGDDTDLYRWSIACGMVNGFAHICERTGIEKRGGNTRLTGKYPLSGIAYRSTRKDKPSIN